MFASLALLSLALTLHVLFPPCHQIHWVDNFNSFVTYTPLSSLSLTLILHVLSPPVTRSTGSPSSTPSSWSSS